MESSRSPSHERVHPRKGFELILANHGTCRAITCFGQYPDPATREESAHLLVQTLHAELAGSLKRVIERQDGKAPESESLPELIAGRSWLFEGNSYYIDTSHVISVVQFGVELTKPETLQLIVELTEYGKHLSEMFQHPGGAPVRERLRRPRGLPACLARRRCRRGDSALPNQSGRLRSGSGRQLPRPSPGALSNQDRALQRGHRGVRELSQGRRSQLSVLSYAHAALSVGQQLRRVGTGGAGRRATCCLSPRPVSRSQALPCRDREGAVRALLSLRAARSSTSRRVAVC